MIRLPFLDAAAPDAFPPVEHALAEPDGLLAAGGDLSPPRLLAAYRRGIFPWYSRGEPILWWSPAMRAVFDTGAMHVPRRLARWLRGCTWTLRADTAFAEVVRACAAPRAKQRGTWITPEMHAAYVRLHRLGHAHSVEAWDGDRLAGGIYGVAIGRMFFGESMFSAAPNGSKVALLALARLLHARGCPLLDAQVASPHLFTLGARLLPRAEFCARVAALTGGVPPTGADASSTAAEAGPAGADAANDAARANEADVADRRWDAAARALRPPDLAAAAPPPSA
ncbi:MAG TPA: leucyl/phenylalanyl-tRNA--protein transferase [Dokdonella sp.]